MATQILEGTWEEITRRSKELVGRKIRVTVLEDENLPRPNQKALDAMRRIEERHKDMRETDGKDSLEMLRRARAGEMFGDESDD